MSRKVTNVKYAELNEELNTLLDQVGGPAQKLRQIPVLLSELPDSVPAGSLCEVSSVESTAQLKFRDLVMIPGRGGDYRLRRVLKTRKDGVILGGDKLNDITPHHYQGKILRVENASSQGKKLKLKGAADIGVYGAWLQACFIN